MSHQNVFSVVVVVCLLGILTGCGDGKSAKGTETPKTVSKPFTVSLASVTVTRPSTGEPLEVNVSDISADGILDVEE